MTMSITVSFTDKNIQNIGPQQFEGTQLTHEHVNEVLQKTMSNYSYQITLPGVESKGGPRKHWDLRILSVLWINNT